MQCILRNYELKKLLFYFNSFKTYFNKNSDRMQIHTFQNIFQALKKLNYISVLVIFDEFFALLETS